MDKWRAWAAASGAPSIPQPWLWYSTSEQRKGASSPRVHQPSASASVSAPPPGPIDVSPLCDYGSTKLSQRAVEHRPPPPTAADDASTAQRSAGSLALSPTLSLSSCLFEAVPAPVGRALYAWHGGDTVIEREVVAASKEGGDVSLVVETAVCTVVVLLLGDADQADEPLPTISFCLPRGESVEHLYSVVADHMGRQPTDVRLVSLSVRSTYHGNWGPTPTLDAATATALLPTLCTHATPTTAHSLSLTTFQRGKPVVRFRGTLDTHLAATSTIALPSSLPRTQHTPTAPLVALVADSRRANGRWPASPPSPSDATPSRATSLSLTVPGATGLRNHGNTCYLNAALQCLSHCPTLRWFFHSGAYLHYLNRQNPLGSQGDLADAFADLLEQMHSGKWDFTSPLPVLTTLSRSHSQFVLGQQQDAQEVCSVLLDALHEEVKEKAPPASPPQAADASDEDTSDSPPATPWTAFLSTNSSHITRTMYFPLTTSTLCLKCGKEGQSDDPAALASLPIPQEHAQVVVSVRRLRVMTTGVLDGSGGGVGRWEFADGGDGGTVPLADDDGDVVVVVDDAPSGAELVDDSGHAHERPPPLTTMTSPQAVAVSLPTTATIGTLLSTLTNSLSLSAATELIAFVVDHGMIQRKLDASRVIRHMSPDARVLICETWQASDSGGDGGKADRVQGKGEDEDVVDLSVAHLVGGRFAPNCNRDSPPDTPSPTPTPSPPPASQAAPLSYSYGGGRFTYKPTVAAAPLAVHAAPTCASIRGPLSYRRLLVCLLLPLWSQLRPDGRQMLREQVRLLSLAWPPVDVDMDSDDRSEVGDESDATEVVPPFGRYLRIVAFRSHERVSTTTGTDLFPTHAHADPDALLSIGTDCHVVVRYNTNRQILGEIFSASDAGEPTMPSRLDTAWLPAPLCLPPPPSSMPLPQSPPSLVDCLRLFTSKNRLDGDNAVYCEVCRGQVPKEVQLSYGKLPHVLVLALKRFGVDETGREREKVQTFVDFPLDGLDMSPFTTGGRPEAGDKSDTLYDCFGVVHHMGGLHSGHYVATVRDLAGGVDTDDLAGWLRCDDSLVRRATSRDEIVSDSAYVLFYMNRGWQKQVELERAMGGEAGAQWVEPPFQPPSPATPTPPSPPLAAAATPPPPPTPPPSPAQWGWNSYRSLDEQADEAPLSLALTTLNRDSNPDTLAPSCISAPSTPPLLHRPLSPPLAQTPSSFPFVGEQADVDGLCLLPEGDDEDDTPALLRDLD